MKRLLIGLLRNPLLPVDSLTPLTIEAATNDDAEVAALALKSIESSGCWTGRASRGIVPIIFPTH